MGKRGLLIVFSGPSGVGKGTVLKELLKINKNIKLSISATTRPKRDFEENGKDYYFLSEKEFLDVALNGGMLEYAKYCGNYYGSPKQQIKKWLNSGFDVVLEIEVEGGKKVRKNCSDAVGIFILPPSIKALEKRLKGRGTESKDVIINRLDRARKEIQVAFEYDYAVVNDEIEKCAQNMNAIIIAEKMKIKNIKNFIEEVLI
ncbi:MAG: Guanylate kinase [Eubacteriales bacterium SKADARSKE-1]|nr:Guanylate kinase [Eubacteriales bacterium SKADARSKE-1]